MPHLIPTITQESGVSGFAGFTWKDKGTVHILNRVNPTWASRVLDGTMEIIVNNLNEAMKDAKRLYAMFTPEPR